MTQELMNTFSNKLKEIDEMPLTDQMKTLVAGSSIREESVRAFRLLCAEQFQPVMEAALR